MSGSAIGLSLGYGFAGNVSRTPDCIIAAKPVAESSASIPFGCPVVLNTDNTYSSPASVGLSAANFAGLAVAEVKQGYAFPPGNQVGTYESGQACDVLQRGVMSVKNYHGTPTAGGTVYARTVLNPSFPSEPVGAIRADSDSAFTVALPNTYFTTGLVDSNSICEITITKGNR